MTPKQEKRIDSRKQEAAARHFKMKLCLSALDLYMKNVFKDTDWTYRGYILGGIQERKLELIMSNSKELGICRLQLEAYFKEECWKYKEPGSNDVILPWNDLTKIKETMGNLIKQWEIWVQDQIDYPETVEEIKKTLKEICQKRGLRPFHVQKHPRYTTYIYGDVYVGDQGLRAYLIEALGGWEDCYKLYLRIYDRDFSYDYVVSRKLIIRKSRNPRDYLLNLLKDMIKELNEALLQNGHCSTEGSVPQPV